MLELWCWRRLFRVPWTARRSNQSIVKEIKPEYLLEGLMLKLKLQYFGHLMRRTNSLEKILMLGQIESGRRRGQQRMRQLHGISDVMNTSLSWWWTGKPGMLQSMESKSWILLSYWTELNNTWMHSLIKRHGACVWNPFDTLIPQIVLFSPDYSYVYGLAGKFFVFASVCTH